MRKLQFCNNFSWKIKSFSAFRKKKCLEEEWQVIWMNFKCSRVIMAEKNHRQSSVRTVLDRGVQKEAKICVVCERLFTWRKKWERNWAEVTTCSERCKRERKQRQKQKKSETTIWMRLALKGVFLKMCSSYLPSLICDNVIKLQQQPFFYYFAKRQVHIIR